MLQMRLMRKTRSAVLAATVVAGGTLFQSSCSVADFQRSFIAGTQTFVQGYTADLLASFVPSAGDLLGGVGG